MLAQACTRAPACLRLKHDVAPTHVAPPSNSLQPNLLLSTSSPGLHAFLHALHGLTWPLPAQLLLL